nr:reverse transcriptase domain-containing protein [Tanacetum cinerariifolium]
MRTRSQSRNNFPQQEASPAIVEPIRIKLSFLEDQFQEDPPEDPPEVLMAHNRTMAELLQAPTEGYEDAIVISEIAANNFELKHGLINLVQNKQFFGHDKEDPHAHIRYFNKITSTMRVSNVSSSSIKLMLFLFSLEGEAQIWREKEPPRSILTWDDLVTKFINQACPHHGFSKLHQLDTFYNALNVNDQDSLNSAAGGNFLDKMPRECLKIIESKSKVRQSRAKAVVAKVSMSSSTPAISSEVVELKDLVRALLLDKKNQSSSLAQSSTPAPVKAVEPNCVTCGGSGTLPSNTITNPKEDLKGITTRSGVAYQGPIIPTPSKVVKKGTEVTKDQVQTPSSQSTAPVQPSVVQPETQTPIFKPVVAPVRVLMPNLKLFIPYPSRRALVGNKEKLSEMARTPMNENCSAVILNKLPRKLGDPSKFLIPCEFPGIDECLALADLGASINPMPLFVLEGLLLPELTPTCMTLELANRSVSKPIAVQHQRRVNPKIYDVIKKEVEKLLDAGLIYPISDSPWVSPVHCVPKKGGFTVVENEENELIPTRLVTGWRLCIDYRKRKLHSPVLTKRLPIDECLSVYAMHRARFKCVAIFHDMVEKTMEVFMNDFSVFGNSFENCLSRLDKMLQRCEDTNLCLNSEKSHFMVKEGIVLGHKISKNGIEADRAKSMSLLNYLIPQLSKNTPFIFSEDCIKAFQMLKKKLTEAPILIVPNWDLPFELMCDASDFAIGAVLGKRHEKHFKPIHYASKTMTDAESNYTTMEKEMLAVVYALENFRSYLIMNKSIVHTDHSTLKYLFAKKRCQGEIASVGSTTPRI